MSTYKITKVPKPKYKVDLMMEEIVSQNADTMDVEELRLMLHEMVRKVYALP
ncbi:MAG: hypothetical protein VZQ98_14625 [Bacteroidales bacterium]|nr:hypothetical protein [Bacteroidales bacterium]